MELRNYCCQIINLVLVHENTSMWNGTDRGGRLVPTGVYIYRLVAVPENGGETFAASRKMVMMK